MLTHKQIKLFGAFLRRPYNELTYAQIKEHAKEKSNSLIQNAIAAYLAEGLVKKRRIGNIYLYSANLENSTVFSYFNILVQESMSALVKNSMKIFREEISGKEFSLIVIFGSHADGTARKDSDLDIAIIINSAEDKKDCVLAAKSAALKSLVPLDVHVFTKDEMLQMLKDRHENLGKQIARKHLVIQNPSIFYAILQEGIDNGFKIIHQEGGK